MYAAARVPCAIDARSLAWSAAEFQGFAGGPRYPAQVAVPFRLTIWCPLDALSLIVREPVTEPFKSFIPGSAYLLVGRRAHSGLRLCTPGITIRMKRALRESVLEMIEADAEARLAKFRATYEPILGGLAEYLLVGLPRWVSKEEQLDNWEEDERGATAKRLVEAVMPEPGFVMQNHRRPEGQSAEETSQPVPFENKFEAQERLFHC
jgi:hypothetical protein